ncbi:MAG: hypothetical protein EPO24_16480 [Bacteroidetes bacterium]|nr:MAG: hypothetical protein EPO24_16480 [Bacteroidota bacterium]
MEEQSQRILIIVIAVLVALSSLAVVLFFLLRAYRKNNRVINEDEDMHGALAQYNCPKCSQQMKKGFALAGRGIIYQPEEHARISSFVTIMSVLENTMSMSLPPAVNRAWHCDTCKYLILDHSTLIRQKKK